jgi:hypothetical protein
MSKTPEGRTPTRDLPTFSVRFQPDDLKWLEAFAAERGVTRANLFEVLIRDYRTFFGLPPTLVEVLNQDAKARKMGILTYLQHLVSLRVQDIHRMGPGFKEPSGK